MKIVYLNPSGQSGGAEAILLDLLASLREAQPGWRLHLILGEPGPVVERAAALGVTVEVVPFPREVARLGDAGAGGPAGHQIRRLAWAQGFAGAISAVLGYRNRLKRAIAEAQPDLIHSNGFKMHILGLWARPAGVPLIWHVHDYVSKRPLMARLMHLFASGCAEAITNSESVAADLRKVCPRLRVSPVLNAIDLTRFTPDGPSLDLDTLAGLPAAAPGTVRVGLLGTMARWKGHQVFLEALAKVAGAVPVRGYIVGGALYQTEGSQWKLEELREKARQLGVADKVGFTGFVDQPAAAMRALDVVVHASTQAEPFGLVIVEAMACGRAVIVSRAGGAAEVMRAGVDALAHTPGDAGQLAGCIERLARDPGLRTRLGAAGRATAVRSFDAARLAGDLIPVYRRAAPSQPGFRAAGTAGAVT